MKTFATLEEKFHKLYAAEEFIEAYTLLTEADTIFPEQHPYITYLRICMAARFDPRQACSVFSEALASGLWFARMIIEQSPSLQLLKDSPAFAELSEHSACLAAEYESGQVMFQAEPAGCPSPYPLLFVMHGNQSTAQAEFPHWQPASAEGYFVAAPNSSVAIWPGNHAWVSHEQAVSDATKHIKALQQTKSLSDDIVLGGFSMGGEASIQACLNGNLPSKRFIAVGPGGPLLDKVQPAEWQPLLDEGKERGARGAIFMADGDPLINQEAISAFAAAANGAGVPCQLVSYQGDGHIYPTESRQWLPDALHFVHNA